MVVQVRNVNIPCSIQGKPGRPVEPRIAVRAIVSPTVPSNARDGCEGIRLPGHMGHRSRPQAAQEQEAGREWFHVSSFSPDMPTQQALEPNGNCFLTPRQFNHAARVRESCFLLALISAKEHLGFYQTYCRASRRLHNRRREGAHVDTATGCFCLSPPAERGERVGEGGTNAVADKGSRCLQA